MRRKTNLPMKLISLYVVFSLLISYFGPKKYYDYDFINVCLYIGAALICLWIGFFLRKRVKIVSDHASFATSTIMSGERLLIISLNIAIFSILLELFCLVVNLNMSLSISDMGANYIAIRELLDKQGYSIGILFRFCIGIFRNISLILGFYYFSKLKKKYKMELIVYIMLLILVNIIGYGTQKVLGDILIFFMVASFINMLSWNRIKRIKVMAFCIFICCIVVFIFAIIQNQRYGAIGVTAQNYESRSDGSTYYDLDNIVFKIFGLTLGFGIGSVLSYVSGGYYGLSLALKLPFVWTYGLGSSYFISLVCEKILGISIYNKTYLGRLEAFGRDGLASWNTIFPWLASDFTFFGTLLLFVIVGYFLTTVWFEVVRYKNPVSIVMFATLCMGFFYLPANNQLFHGIDSFIATVLTLLFWILCHKKYNYNNEKSDAK